MIPADVAKMAPPSRCSANAWTFDQERILIEFFEANSFLWNITDKDHMNRAMKTAALQDCVDLLGSVDINGSPFFVESLKGKFTNLRTSFQRELKKVEESKKATTTDGEEVPPYTPKWNHYERLMFLKDGGINRSANSTDQPSQQDVDLVCDNMFDVPESGASCSHSTSIDSSFSTEGASDGGVRKNGTDTNRRTTRSTTIAAASAPPVRHNKRGANLAPIPDVDHQAAKRRGRGLSELLVALRHSASRPEDSPEDLFGKHVAASLKSMPDRHSREKAKLEIQKVIHQNMLSND